MGTKDDHPYQLHVLNDIKSKPEEELQVFLVNRHADDNDNPIKSKTKRMFKFDNQGNSESLEILLKNGTCANYWIGLPNQGLEYFSYEIAIDNNLDSKKFQIVTKKTERQKKDLFTFIKVENPFRDASISIKFANPFLASKSSLKSKTDLKQTNNNVSIGDDEP